MEANRILFKIFTTKPVELESFVPVFHRFIREQVLDELPIDVADYAHVHEGPGVVLIGHAFDYYLDLRGGRLGLVYLRKRDAPAPAARLKDAARRALRMARLLEPAIEGLSFKTDEFWVSFPDRLRAADSDENFAALKGELDALTTALVGTPGKVERDRSAGNVLAATVSLPGNTKSVAELLAKLE
jgi:hypothetical protein